MDSVSDTVAQPLLVPDTDVLPEMVAEPLLDGSAVTETLLLTVSDAWLEADKVKKGDELTDVLPDGLGEPLNEDD